MNVSFLKNPVLQFVLLGAGVFWLHGLTEDAERLAQPENIVLDQRYLDGLEQELASTLMRQPSDYERQALIDKAITREVLFREALRRELDRGDAIIRRHLIQKMEFLLEAQSKPDTPARSELLAWWEQHPDRYREAERISFQQVFFASDSGKRAAFEARMKTGELKPDQAVEMGDHFLGGHAFRGQKRTQIDALFGEGFAEHFDDARKGHWVGPVQSLYGQHYVYLSEYTLGRQQSFEEAYSAVYTDLVKHLTGQRRAQSMAQMRDQYRVLTPQGDEVALQ